MKILNIVLKKNQDDNCKLAGAIKSMISSWIELRLKEGIAADVIFL
jgi:hypothetical protein